MGSVVDGVERGSIERRPRASRAMRSQPWTDRSAGCSSLLLNEPLKYALRRRTLDSNCSAQKEVKS